MTRPLHRLHHHARRAVRVTLAFFGPVADSIRGELNKEERQRIAVKMIATVCMAHGAVDSMTKDPTIYTDFVGPVALAAGVGALDAFRRLRHGTEPGTPPDGPSPPASTPSEQP